MKSREEVIERITEYLSMGGLLNPESMDHDKVRDLLVDCRIRLRELEAYMIPVNPSDDSVGEAWATLRKYGVEDGPEFVDSIDIKDVRGAVSAAFQVARMKAAERAAAQVTP